jgi:hypothetical protein
MDCYRYAMPTRETFSWTTPGQRKAFLYDSTLQECTAEAANTMAALLFPNWTRWCELTPGTQVPKSHRAYKSITEGLQLATKTFFDYLNHSNFATVINEVALDLQVGTGALKFDEGDDEQPFIFSSVPLSVLELEEGPNGAVENKYMLRKPRARNLLRMYPGMQEFDLPRELAEQIEKQPDSEIEIVQCEIFDPGTRKHYGIVVDCKTKAVIWRFLYGVSAPTIVPRASKIAGETYGRGRVMLALDDARTLDKVQEFVLRQLALQIAPPLMGVSDGILNPYTAVLAPNTIIPVATNDSGNPSLRPIELGGNFRVGENERRELREKIRRTMLGPEPSEGPVKSATEIGIADRNRLWALGGEYGRIQVELLAPIVVRGVHILQSRGLMPEFKLNGKAVSVSFTSPFAKSQNADDVLGLQRTIDALLGMGEPGMAVLSTGLKVENVPAWLAEKNGVDMSLVRSEAERDEQMKQTAEVAQMAAESGAMGGA